MMVAAPGFLKRTAGGHSRPRPGPERRATCVFGSCLVLASSMPRPTVAIETAEKPEGRVKFGAFQVGFAAGARWVLERALEERSCAIQHRTHGSGVSKRNS